MNEGKKIALISVFHKGGITEFARQLLGMGWEILASGGTARHLQEAGLSVRDIATLVGEPILGHRVVTLSREIHAGLLAKEEHRQELESRGIPWIDLVCVDLYPLQLEIARPGSTPESVTEMTDIGGPALLRSAAKGRRIVVCDPQDRQTVINEIKGSGQVNNLLVDMLAAKAEFTAARYCLDSASFMSHGLLTGLAGSHHSECMYGENAWQNPADLFSSGSDDPLALDKFVLVEGAPPSFNNRCDTDRALQTLTHIAAAMDVNSGRVPMIAIAVKHGNPCGAAYGHSAEGVLKNVVMGDTLAIMGGTVMANFTVDEECAEILSSFPEGSPRRLLDAVVAAGFTDKAVGCLRRKKDKCRFIENAKLSALSKESLDAGPRFRHVRGGFLRQPNYTFVPNLRDAGVVERNEFGRELQPQTIENIALAWAVGSTSNSNTITLVRNGMLIGNGVGQQDRVGAAELALWRAKRAGHSTDGAVAYSDSFFPFPDGPKKLIDAGVSTILTSSGSINDSQTMKLCEGRGVALLMIPDKAGRGFFGH